jgi:hypothetical protein
MFEPSIKEENVIVIEDHSEDSKVGVKEKEERLPLHRKTKENKNLGKTTERGKQIDQFPTGPVTRATMILSRVEALYKGTGRISKNKDDHPCYNPKLYHTCLLGIRPTHILSLPKTLLNNSLKILLCKGPRALTHYCTRVHAG